MTPEERVAPNQRPESFTVDYHGEPFTFTRTMDGKGYSYATRNGSGFWIDTESGTRHKLSFDSEGRATIVGSIVDLRGFHVMVENGVMRDV